MITAYIPYLIAAILLVAMALELRTGRIPNWLTLLPFALFAVALIMADDWAVLLPQVYLAIAVFVAGLLLFAFAGFGAGAVKLMTGLVLFVPWGEAGYTLATFVAALFVCAFLIVQLRKAFGSETSGWHVWRKPVMPMSLPIGLAGLASLFWF